MINRAIYVMIGGFLGAGKTTAIIRFAQHLTRRGLKVGLITNDQSQGLVDTTLLRSRGFDVEEITGGCFCCRFKSLMDASEKLSAQTRPDVFLAEPVGSCTDLRAAVSYPLRRIYGDNYRVAPLSVLVDPVRALRILGLEAGKAFSSKVLYVYQKQLEEAEMLVVNKCDLLSSQKRETLEKALRARFPQAELFTVSAREGIGLETWFDRITVSELGGTIPPDVDYDLYAEGEALLGWLNATLRLVARRPIDGNLLLRGLACDIAKRLEELSLEIAHLKMTLTPDEDLGDIGVLNLVRNDGSAELSHSLKETLENGVLILNLRAEADPEIVRGVVMDSLSDASAQNEGLEFRIEHEEHFRPARPVPTYRMAGA